MVTECKRTFHTTEKVSDHRRYYLHAKINSCSKQNFPPFFPPIQCLPVWSTRLSRSAGPERRPRRGGGHQIPPPQAARRGRALTDGSVRDTDEIINYGFPCFSYSTTSRQGPAAMQPCECNGVISVSGVTVRPGDAIVGDQDGVVVVRRGEGVQHRARTGGHRGDREGGGDEEPGPPGRFYPFMSGKIKVDSPLGKLLATKGITPENSNQFEGSADW